MGSRLSVCPPSNSSAARREDLEGHHGGCRIARQSEEELAARASEHQRLAGLNQHAVEEKLRAQVRPARVSTRSYLPAETPPESSSRSASRPCSIGDPGRVVARRWRRAGCWLPRPRAPPAPPASTRWNCESGNRTAAGPARRFRRRSPESPRAACGIRARGPRRWWRAARPSCNRAAVPPGSPRHRFELQTPGDSQTARGVAAGQPIRRSSRVTCSTMTTASAPRGTGAPVMISTASPDSPRRKRLAGAHLADDQRARRIRGPHGESVANRAGERRIIAIGPSIAGKHAPRGAVEPHFIDGRRCARRGDSVDHQRARIVERKRGHSSHSSPGRI